MYQILTINKRIMLVEKNVNKELHNNWKIILIYAGCNNIMEEGGKWVN